MIDLTSKRVLVTGSSGFLGRALCETLKKRGAIVIEASHEKCNLLNLYDVIQYLDESLKSLGYIEL